MRFFKDQFAFTINTSHSARLVKVWERLDSIRELMKQDEYATIVPLVEGVEEDLEAVIEDIEELAEARLRNKGLGGSKGATPKRPSTHSWRRSAMSLKLATNYT